MSILLPQLSLPAEFDALRSQNDRWLPAIQAICQQHQLPDQPLQFFTEGSSVVVSLAGQYVLKLMPPFWAADGVREAQVLDWLSLQADLPVPQLFHHGDLEGWYYLVMAHLPGTPGEECWPRLAPESQQALMSQLGKLLRRMHGLSVSSLPLARVDWPLFVQQQRSGFVARQRHFGVDEAWIQVLDRFLEQEANHLPAVPGTPALLHCELMPAHLLFTEQGGQWQISGLFDFGDPLVSHPLYEIAALCVFFTARRPDLLRALMLAYGYSATELTAELSRQLMAVCLLHQFMSVPFGLRQLPDQAEASATLFLETFFSFESVNRS